MSFEDHLTSAMRVSVDTLSPPVTELAGGGLRRGRQLRRRRRLAAGGAAVALVAVAGAGTAALLRDDGAPSPVVTASGSCAAPRFEVLPTWARDGFSDPEPRATYVLSDDGRMAAILFGPLRSPQPDGTSNKILWVERPDSPGLPLHIEAVLPATGRHAARDLGGPGPSIVDLPQPGCWTLSLRWGEFRDTIHLDYARP